MPESRAHGEKEEFQGVRPAEAAAGCYPSRMIGIDNLIREYGLWAVFFGVMIEGDLTLLFAGVLAHYGLFSFGEAFLIGLTGGFVGDSVSYLIGHTGKQQIRSSYFYQRAQPRLEQLCHRFGIYSVFLVKYIYGLRTASAIFYGFAPMKYRRFAPLTLLSCATWVLILTGAGYFFSGAIEILIGRVRQAGIILLVALLIALGIALLLFLLERYVIARKVPEMEPPQLFEKHFNNPNATDGD
ncbi:MAG TPA: DedA family protein [Blastocatellia bacterium]|nr:DedA family protein [Blastocatellia bacterium]